MPQIIPALPVIAKISIAFRIVIMIYLLSISKHCYAIKEKAANTPLWASVDGEWE